MIFKLGVIIFKIIRCFLLLCNKKYTWVFYILQMLFSTIISLQNNMYKESINNTLFLIMGLIGFILWMMKGNNDVSINNSVKEKIKYSMLIAIGTVFFQSLIKSNNDPLAFLNAFTIGSSLVSVYYKK